MTLSKATVEARRRAREAREADKAEQIRSAIQDGWPLREIYRTHNTSSRFVKRWLPDYAGMPARESGNLSMAIQKRKKVFSS